MSACDPNVRRSILCRPIRKADNGPGTCEMNEERERVLARSHLGR